MPLTGAAYNMLCSTNDIHCLPYIIPKLSLTVSKSVILKIGYGPKNRCDLSHYYKLWCDEHNRNPSQHPLTLLPSPSSLPFFPPLLSSPSSLILPNTKMLLNPSLNNGFSDWIHLLIHIYVDCLGSWISSGYMVIASFFGASFLFTDTLWGALLEIMYLLAYWTLTR